MGSPCTQAQAGDIGAPAVFQDLAATPGVEIQLKRLGAPLIHLESYQIDGRRLRTGAANFSASGEKQQDNDLIVIESAEAAAAFKRAFGGRFCRWRGSVGCDAVAAPSWHRDYGANCPPLSALIHPSAVGKWAMFQFESPLPTDAVEKGFARRAER